MTEEMKIANELIRILREQREEYRDFAEQEIQPLYEEERDRQPPDFFVDSSYLYIRSFDNDNGARPFANQVYWNSPDIKISSYDKMDNMILDLIAGRIEVGLTSLSFLKPLMEKPAGKQLRLIGPSMTKGLYAFDYGDTAKLTDLIKTALKDHKSTLLASLPRPEDQVPPRPEPRWW